MKEKEILEVTEKDINQYEIQEKNNDFFEDLYDLKQEFNYGVIINNGSGFLDPNSELFIEGAKPLQIAINPFREAFDNIRIIPIKINSGYAITLQDGTFGGYISVREATEKNIQYINGKYIGNDNAEYRRIIDLCSILEYNSTYIPFKLKVKATSERILTTFFNKMRAIHKNYTPHNFFIKVNAKNSTINIEGKPKNIGVYNFQLDGEVNNEAIASEVSNALTYFKKA